MPAQQLQLIEYQRGSKDRVVRCAVIACLFKGSVVRQPTHFHGNVSDLYPAALIGKQETCCLAACSSFACPLNFVAVERADQIAGDSKDTC